MNRTAIEQTERMRNVLAFLVIGSFIMCFPLLALKAIPKDNKDILTYMVGQLSGIALTVVGFYFVSKVGQEALDAKRADTTNKMADAVVAAAAGTPPPDGAGRAADEVAGAAQDKANEIKEGN